MKFKLNAMVAAVTALASVGAHAAMETMDSANGTLALVVYDTQGPNTGSFMADLNFNIDDFLPTSTAVSQPIVWNFNLNTISVGGVQQAGLAAYSTEFAKLTAGTQTSEIRWGVVGGDNFGQRYVTTGAPTTANLASTGTTSQTEASTALMANMEGLWLDNNVVGTHAASATGAAFSLSSDAAYSPVDLPGNIGTNGTWNGALKWSATLANNVASKFFLVDNGTLRGSVSSITTYGNPNVSAPSVASSSFSTFAYDQSANTLTWTAASPIPEPGTYAMLLAGLAAIGFIARRRST